MPGGERGEFVRRGMGAIATPGDVHVRTHEDQVEAPIDSASAALACNVSLGIIVASCATKESAAVSGSAVNSETVTSSLPSAAPFIRPLAAAPSPSPVVSEPSSGSCTQTSSGASLAAVNKKLPDIADGARVLTFCYDTGERYLSVEGLFPEAPTS